MIGDGYQAVGAQFIAPKAGFDKSNPYAIILHFMLTEQ
jgi:hypothetical protein